MRFLYPILLWLLALIPLFLWLRYFRKRTGVAPFSDSNMLIKLPKSWRIWLQPLFPLLFALGLACLIVALARPQKGVNNTKNHTEGIDIILLLDLSRSMNHKDFYYLNRPISRLDATKAVVSRFLEKRPNDRIGIVAFASLPYAIAPLTLDHQWLKKRVEVLHTGMLDGRHTAIGDGMASAINRLRESDAKSKIIILLTDGANNYGRLSPENAADAAAALGIKIYTIGAGDDRGGFFQQDLEVDEPTLRNVAKITSGSFYRARDLKSLKAVYAEIDQLEKSKIEVNQFTRYSEYSAGLIVAGLLLLLAEQLLSLSKVGRLI